LQNSSIFSVATVSCSSLTLPTSKCIWCLRCRCPSRSFQKSWVSYLCRHLALLHSIFPTGASLEKQRCQKRCVAVVVEREGNRIKVRHGLRGSVLVTPLQSKTPDKDILLHFDGLRPPLALPDDQSFCNSSNIWFNVLHTVPCNQAARPVHPACEG
jgi:hypothetical protein